MNTKRVWGRWYELGNCDWHVYTTDSVYTIDIHNQREPPVERREFYQCSVVTWVGKNSKKEGICEYVLLIPFAVQYKLTQ